MASRKTLAGIEASSIYDNDTVRCGAARKLLRPVLKTSAEGTSSIEHKKKYFHKPWVCPECGRNNLASVCGKCFRDKHEE